eukprot:TRINITY_DN3891_c0_g1_i2.p1 TRINITY_DN3891_c0_g1~~TRINITY_DN3891_c0_g1_i2.p1  ORF type:complete len:273 (-),score=33.14 TRINITY_DN3891_c0_g1_i2:175-972(-)
MGKLKKKKMANKALKCSKCPGIWFETPQIGACSCYHSPEEVLYAEILEQQSSETQPVINIEDSHIEDSPSIHFNIEESHRSSELVAKELLEESYFYQTEPTITEGYPEHNTLATEQNDLSLTYNPPGSNQNTSIISSIKLEKAKVSRKESEDLINEICDDVPIITCLKSLCQATCLGVFDLLEALNINQRQMPKPKTIAIAVIYLVTNAKKRKIDLSKITRGHVTISTVQKFYKELTTTYNTDLAVLLGGLDPDLKELLKRGIRR